ncbi:hypothetical protein AB1Y20_010120 [Prymnesium parvum]|uniref:Phosphatidic acid phosphatase type 2/haloperoxidase domain-containing protein n=1 Tax=Prymnesium parvum TaxID=97485 RepID=A0AB34K3H5_PRYPA
MEQEGLLAGSASPRTSLLARWSLGDWAVTAVLFVAGVWADHAAPFHRQIVPQEHDPAISYKHTPSDHARIPTPLLFKLAFWLPLSVLVAIMLLCPAGKSFSQANRMSQLNEAALGLCSSFASTLLVVSLIKNQVGRLRPDFLDRCKLEAGICTGLPAVIMEGRKSFPSGHTALSFAGLGFLTLYIGARLYHVHACCGELWKLPVVLAPWFAALCVGLSRIADYWHHWEDVLVGGLIGNLIAYIMYRQRYPLPSDDQGGLPYVLQVSTQKQRSSPPSNVQSSTLDVHEFRV